MAFLSSSMLFTWKSHLISDFATLASDESSSLISISAVGLALVASIPSRRDLPFICYEEDKIQLFVIKHPTLDT